MNREEIQNDIEEYDSDNEQLNEDIEELKERIESLENNENTDEYDEMLDDCYPKFMDYYPSDILKSVDPIAYRVGHSDFNDSKLSELNEELEDKEKELADNLLNIQKLQEQLKKVE